MVDPVAAPVSVVIPCFRCAKTIERAVRSVARQTMPPTRVYLVDDASQDETVSVLEGLKSKYPVGWIEVLSLETNSGPAKARKAGWERASTPFVAFLDSDDTWLPEKVGQQYSWMIRNEEASLSAHARVMSKSGIEIPGRTKSHRVA